MTDQRRPYAIHGVGECDRLCAVVGRIDPERRRNWVEQLAAAHLHVARTLGSEREADAFSDAFLGCLGRPDTASYTALCFVSRTAPSHA